MRGESIAKVVALNGQNGALSLVQNGNPNLAGFFARSNDVFDAPTTPGLIDRLRIDGDATNFLPGSPHAIIETRANAAIAGQARIPRTQQFTNGHALEEVVDRPYPYTGNGLTGSRDGHLTPEFKVAGSQAIAMDAGSDALGQPVTTMKFRFDDGTPYPQTINGQTASDWRLIVDPDNAELRKWVPLP